MLSAFHRLSPSRVLLVKSKINNYYYINKKDAVYRGREWINTENDPALLCQSFDSEENNSCDEIEWQWSIERELD